MGFYKPIKNAGYNDLVDSECRDYLLGIGKWEKKYHGKRCAKIDYINICRDMPGIPTWDKRMDMSRNFLPRNIIKGQRKYYHYVFSPDPKDNVAVEELSDALTEWCKRCFADKFEIVIGYHKDNKNRVQHAHLYINGINLDPTAKKKTISGYVTPNFIEYSRQLWQYMCKEHGWHNFLDKEKQDIALADLHSIDTPENEIQIKEEIEELFKIDEQYFNKYRYYDPSYNYKRPYKHILSAKINDKNLAKTSLPPFSTKNGKNYTKGALEAKKRGEHLWTDDLRSLIETAYYQSKDQIEFEETLAALDVMVEVTKNDDYKYSHPNVKDNPAWVATGAKLGNDYKKKRISDLYLKVRQGQKINRPSRQVYERLITQIREIGYTEQTRHINPQNKDCSINLQDIAKTMRINSY